MTNNNNFIVKITKTTSEQQLTSDRIIAFIEKPSYDRHDEHTDVDDEICACDLFSYFTADIIKSESIFIR